jgi:hypothetical protein
MLTNLDRVRLNNLFAAIEKAVDAAERLGKSENTGLKDVARSLIGRLEDMTMEVGMELAEDEDSKVA